MELEPRPRRLAIEGPSQAHGEVASAIVDLNRQHVRIFHLVENFNRSAHAMAAREQLLAIFDEILHEARDYFAYEDWLCMAIDFPGYEVRRLKHEQIVQGIEQTRNEWESATGVFPIGSIEHALDSLLVHLIQEEVSSIARYLAGAREPE